MIKEFMLKTAGDRGEVILRFRPRLVKGWSIEEIDSEGLRHTTAGETLEGTIKAHETSRAPPDLTFERGTMASLCADVAEQKGWTVRDLMTSKKSEHLHVRQDIALKLHESGLSLSKIGRHFGARHHTTVWGWVQSAKKRRAQREP